MQIKIVKEKNYCNYFSPITHVVVMHIIQKRIDFFNNVYQGENTT